jgi:DNA helicase IV
MPHPDVALERARLRLAQEYLEAMRDRTQRRIADEAVLAANEPDAEAVKWQLHLRLASLEDDAAALCFGRIDERAGERWYIGRRHVEDGDGAPVVVDWRAEVATPFYRATLADPFGLHLRRRFIFSGRELHDIFDEDFDDPDSLVGTGGVPDPLLAELGRARTGQMRDIVATIQGEQDTIIRAPLERCLVVQGGPGTGKTAVGLHRAAFLLYEHRALLSREGVLVVGPNPVFLRYISQVLPSLGETTATQMTVDQLLSLRFRVRGEDPDAVAAVKGDARMATVIARAANQIIKLPVEGLTLAYRARRLELTHADLERLVEESQRRRAPVTTQRQRFREALVRAVYAQFTRGELLGTDEQEWGAELLALPANRKAVDTCWRPVNAVAVVRNVLTQKAVLARAAAGLLDADEQALVLRRRADAEMWTTADLPLLDEAEAIVKGAPRRFAHIVVDEAQDLSPMQLRMLARRARGHSMTILGDLAQATGPASSRSWEESLTHLGRPANSERAELTIGYRLPGAILDLANRLLPYAAADVTPSRSVRDSGDPPDLHAFAADELVDAVAEHAFALAKEMATVAVITDPARVDGMRAALEAQGAVLAEPGEVSPEHPLVVVPAPLAKGLEFDAVIVVEPAEIVEHAPHGVRMLFVALTRAVQHLAIAHSRPLPDMLFRPSRPTGEARTST